MIEAFTEFTFEAAHRLELYSGLHGHTFTATVYFRGEPHPVYGWAASLIEVEREVDLVRQSLDEKFLNEIDGLSVPSIENVAGWIWHRLRHTVPGLDRVVLRRGARGSGSGCVFDGSSLPRAAAAA